jgi:cobalt-zinc-cadmium efflux system membrane fusion protein
MKNKFFCRVPRAERQFECTHSLAGAVIAVTILVAITGCSRPADESPNAQAVTPSNVTLSASQLQNIHLYTVASSGFHKMIETTGVVDFDNDQATGVVAPFSGPVSRLFVSPGQRVAKGQPLAEVDSSDFATAISAYSKTFVAARNTRRIADVDKDLIQHNGVSRRENDQAQTDAASAAADRDAAMQGLISLGVDAQTIKEIQAGKMTSRARGIIRSPIAGTVAEKLITTGQLLQAGTTPCFTIADLSRVWVIAQISSSDLASISVGDTADVLTGIATDHLTGTLDNISAVVDPDTRAIAARVVVHNPGGALRKKMYVRVQIHSQQQGEGVQVPVSAILRDDENLPFVYVVKPGDSFARQPVTLGDRIGEQYVIPEGLKAADRIVIDGGIFMQFMQSQ